VIQKYTTCITLRRFTLAFFATILTIPGGVDWQGINPSPKCLIHHRNNHFLVDFHVKTSPFLSSFRHFSLATYLI